MEEGGGYSIGGNFFRAKMFTYILVVSWDQQTEVKGSVSKNIFRWKNTSKHNSTEVKVQSTEFEEENCRNPRGKLKFGSAQPHLLCSRLFQVIYLQI